MTTIDLETDLSAPRSDTGLKRWIGKLLAEHRHRREQRLTLEELAQFDRYLLRDIGIEPSDIHDALNGNRNSVLFDPMRRRDRD